MSTGLKPLPAPLPPTAAEFRAARKIKSTRTLNDYVESVYLALSEEEKFKAYLYAVYDEQAVTGSLSFDNCKAAEMILAKAEDMGITEISREKPATIAKSLGVVGRRYGFSRKERRDTIGGEIIPSNGE